MRIATEHTDNDQELLMLRDSKTRAISAHLIRLPLRLEIGPLAHGADNALDHIKLVDDAGYIRMSDCTMATGNNLVAVDLMAELCGHYGKLLR